MLSVNNQTIVRTVFPDGTPLIHLARPETSGVTITWHFEDNSEFMYLTMLVGHLRNACGVKSIQLKMPYIPNARQDRVKKSDDVFTLKYFVDAINAMGFDKVIVFDPHSSVSEALFNNLVVISPEKSIRKTIAAIETETNAPLNLFFPDEGSMKRYGTMLQKPSTFGIKQRDWITGTIQGLTISGDMSLIEGQNILIVDDICSRGGTFYHSAKALKEAGANKIYLYVSHCEQTIFQGAVFSSGLIEKVYTTNSIYTGNHEKIHVDDWKMNAPYEPYSLD